LAPSSVLVEHWNWAYSE